MALHYSDGKFLLPAMSVLKSKRALAFEDKVVLLDGIADGAY